jgi:predicted XRE-type DNA-binding protein
MPTPLQQVTRSLHQIKLDVAEDIHQTIEDLGLTQSNASKITYESQSQISLIVNRRIRGFSLERLLRVRALLGAKIRLSVLHMERGARPNISATFN